jgi:hypothetical protein
MSHNTNDSIQRFSKRRRCSVRVTVDLDLRLKRVRKEYCDISVKKDRIVWLREMTEFVRSALFPKKLELWERIRKGVEI